MRNSPGFSLIELLVALGLLAIIVTLVSLNASFMHRALVRSEVDKLSSICMFAASYAGMSNKPQQIALDLQNNTYSFAGHHEKLPPQAQFGVLPNVKGPPSAPTKLLAKPSTFDNNCITATPHGILQPGTVYMIDSAKTCLYALSSSITQHTYIRKYYFDGRWHALTP